MSIDADMFNKKKIKENQLVKCITFDIAFYSCYVFSRNVLLKASKRKEVVVSVGQDEPTNQQQQKQNCKKKTRAFDGCGYRLL